MTRHWLVFLAPLSLSACAFWEVSDWSDQHGRDGAVTIDASPSDAGTRADGDAGIPILAKDDFARTVTKSFGVADIGGAWSIGGGATAFAVTDDHGAITLANAGDGVVAWLEQVSSDDVDMQILLAADKIPVGGSGLYLTLLGRRIDSDTDYNGRVIVRADGEVNAGLAKNVSGTTTPFPGATKVFTALPGDGIRARLQVTGASPTHLRIKVWKATDTEPGAWTLDTVDSTPAYQVKGSVGVGAYVATSTTSVPVVVSVDELLVRPASRL